MYENHPLLARGGSDEKRYGAHPRPQNRNGYTLNPFTRVHWRASVVPTAAVISAPIAYIVAVKKLVLVESVCDAVGSSLVMFNWHDCGIDFHFTTLPL